MQSVHKKGVTVVEILIGVSLFTLIVVFITHALALYFSTGSLLQEKTKALYLAQEGQEVMRYLRDEDWTTLTDLTVGTAYYFDVATTTMATTTVPEIIEGVYTRSVVLENAYRDGNDDLVASTAPGASIDDGGRIVVTKVQWGSGNEIQLESLLTNIFNI
jgi:hypothetical protein